MICNDASNLKRALLDDKEICFRKSYKSIIAYNKIRSSKIQGKQKIKQIIKFILSITVDIFTCLGGNKYEIIRIRKASK